MRAGLSSLLLALLLLGSLVGLSACKKESNAFPLPSDADGFSAAFFPVQIDGSALPANIALMPDADLIVAGNSTDAVYAVSRVDGSRRTLSPLVTGGTANVLSVTANSRSVFAGSSDGKLYRIPLIGGAASEILDLTTGEDITALAIAPGGSYRDQIIAAASTFPSGPGRILAIDPANPTGFVVLLDDAGRAFIDLVFTPDGTLYLLDAVQGQLGPLAQAGGGIPIPGAFNEPVGLSRGRNLNELLVADAADDRVYAVALPGGARTALGRFVIAGAFTPAGLAWDGVRNLMIATAGSYRVRAASLPAFETTGLPLPIPGTSAGFGAFALDAKGDLIGSSNGATNQVFRVDRETGAISVIASGLGAAGEELLAIAYDPVEKAIYLGTSHPRVYEIDQSGAVSTLIDLSATGSGKVYGLAIAPNGYGAIGGQIIASTASGKVYYFSRTGINPLQLIDLGGAVSSLLFGADATLYAARFDTGRVVRIPSPGGGPAVDVTGNLGQPDGLAIDQRGSTLYIADSQGNTLWSVPLPAGTPASNLGTFDFAIGSEPSGLVFDGLANVLAGVGETSLVLSQLPVAP